VDNRDGRLGWLWYGMLVWFAANLLSQSLYMGTYGVPYDAEDVIRALGPYYIPILFVESLAWILAGGWLFKHTLRRRPDCNSIGQGGAHAVD
jgi:hypothetical protein